MASKTLFALSLLAIHQAAAFTLPHVCSDGIMETPTLGTKNAIFTVCSNNTIEGPPSFLYEVLIDFPKYPEWNSFVYKVDVPDNVTSAKDVYIGMPMTFHTSGLLGPINSTSQETVSYLEPHKKTPYAAWSTDFGIITAEHSSILVDLGGGKTRYLSYETYYQVGSVLVSALKANLQKEFVQQGVDLKKRVESLQRGG